MWLKWQPCKDRKEEEGETKTQTVGEPDNIWAQFGKNGSGKRVAFKRGGPAHIVVLNMT